MTNHIHHIVIPKTEAALHLFYKALHVKHAQRVNYRLGEKGRVFEDRFYSCVLDEEHFEAAVRYVELNPVRAGLVQRPSEYLWSSARAHCGLEEGLMLTCHPMRKELIESVTNWEEWLLTDFKDDEKLQKIRVATAQNKIACSRTSLKKRGRPKKGTLPFSDQQYR